MNEKDTLREAPQDLRSNSVRRTMEERVKSRSIIHINVEVKICWAHKEKLNVRCVEFQMMTILVGFYRNKLVLRGDLKAS